MTDACRGLDHGELAKLMVTPQPSYNCPEVSAIQFVACVVVIVVGFLLLDQRMCASEDRIDREYGGQEEGRTASVSNTPMLPSCLLISYGS